MSNDSKQRDSFDSHVSYTVPGDILQPPVVDPVNVTTTTALINWAPPPDPNGIVLSYAVRYVVVSMASGGGIQQTRRRQTGGVIVPECIMGGEGNIDRTEIVTGQETFLLLTELSKFTLKMVCIHEVCMILVILSQLRS